MLAGLAPTAVKVMLSSTPLLHSQQKDSVNRFLTAGCLQWWGGPSNVLFQEGAMKGKATQCSLFLSVGV